MIASDASTPLVAAIVLAAGRSLRMRSNKLLERIADKPIVRHVVETALSSAARPVIVVLGHEAEAVKAALAGLPVTLVRNADHKLGLSTSLKCGLAALPAEAPGTLVLLGDMPAVGPRDIDRLIAAFAPDKGRAICVPTFQAKRGNPVLWARAFFTEMAALKGDVGARSLIGLHADAVAEVEIGDPRILADIDTPEALAAARRQWPGGGA